MPSYNFSDQIFAELEKRVREARDNSLIQCGDKVVELTNNNFRDKSFFGSSWPANKAGTPILVKSGLLRTSIRVQSRSTHTVKVGSVGVIYSSIHNYGGVIRQGNRVITIPQRQYLGAHPRQTAAMLLIIKRNFRNIAR